MATQSTGAGTTDDFHASREYLSLTAKQRVWLDVFISTQDPAQATQTAYNPATETYATLLRYRIEANPRIRAALNLYLGRSEQEVFLEELKETIRRAPKGSDRQVRAQALYARLKFGVAEDSTEPEPASKTEAPALAVASEVPAVRESAPSSIPIFPPAEPKYKVGTIANDPDDGKPYILLAVSADGNDVTEARLLTKNDDGTFFDAVAQGTSPTYDHVPPGARPGYDETTHALIGYGTADGKTVWLIEAAAAR